MVLVAVQTFTASSAVSINSCFSSEYTNYKILMDVSCSATGIDMLMRMRASGADNTSANYYTHNSSDNMSNTTTGPKEITNASSSWTFRRSATSAAGVVQPYLLEVSGPSEARNTWVYSRFSDGGGYSNVGTHRQLSSDIFDGLTFYPASGTISGRICVYGYRKA